MECINLKDEMDKAQRKIDLFGTDNFRSWLLYFVPGNGIVRGLKGEERPIKKDDVLCLSPKDYYQIVNTGSEPLVLFGNRSEAFGGPHILADGSDRQQVQKRT